MIPISLRVLAISLSFGFGLVACGGAEPTSNEPSSTLEERQMQTLFAAAKHGAVMKPLLRCNNAGTTCCTTNANGAYCCDFGPDGASCSPRASCGLTGC